MYKILTRVKKNRNNKSKVAHYFCLKFLNCVLVKKLVTDAQYDFYEIPQRHYRYPQA